MLTLKFFSFTTADYQAVSEQFVTYYYQTFDTNRQGLGGLYRQNSLLTFESSQTQGGTAILEKLANLPFQKVVHKVATQDAQPMANGIVVLVTGALMVDDSPAPLNYSQTFVLMPEGGSYYVAHDIFKLIYPA
ncbi:hypothetical protein AA313_de0206500 [Arthrobotrys entomopaga]|nr:hypothetical protein AA313_de0206500 [Arthrobotrys entomopaga]